MAKITSLEEMEKIVGRNKSLSWNGWDVLYTVPDPVAWRNPSGVFIKNKWFNQKKFELKNDGWDIPNKFVR